MSLCYVALCLCLRMGHLIFENFKNFKNQLLRSYNNEIRSKNCRVGSIVLCNDFKDKMIDGSVSLEYREGRIVTLGFCNYPIKNQMVYPLCLYVGAYDARFSGFLCFVFCFTLCLCLCR